MQVRNVTVPDLPPELAARVAAAQAASAGDAGWAPPCRSIWALLERWAEVSPEQEYLVYYGTGGERRSWTYAAFRDRVLRVAGYLAALGVREGDRIATILHNHVEAVFLYCAAWRLGACVVPVNLEETPQRKGFIVANAGARVCFSLPEYAGQVEGAGAQVMAVAEDGRLPADGGPPPAGTADRLHSGALIVYTSGTTGNPKGVLLTQYNLLADAHAIAGVFGVQPGDRWMCVLPIHHVNGIVVTMLTPLYAGGTWVLNRRFSTQHFWSRAAAERVQIASMVSTLLEFLLQANEDLGRYDLSALRGVICGAGPLLVETAQRFEEQFCPIFHGYGLSETTAYACMTPPHLPAAVRRRWYSEHGFPTLGAAMPGCRMAILGPGGTALGPGERGEICLRGPLIMAGYHQRPDANAAAFPGDGYFHSGDEGFWLPGPEGHPFYFITGRIKELIIRGGVNLSPLEIDEALRAHPAVAFALAVPFANRWYGEEVAAYVVPAPGAAAGPELVAELQGWAAARLPFPQRPKVILFGHDVPYTSTGKPRRLELARQLTPALAPYRDVQFREVEP